MLRSTLTDRGQTTIPAAVREALGLRPRQGILYEVTNDGVLLRAERESLMDLAGSLASPVPLTSKKAERESARAARAERRRG